MRLDKQLFSPPAPIPTPTLDPSRSVEDDDRPIHFYLRRLLFSGTAERDGTGRRDGMIRPVPWFPYHPAVQFTIENK